MTGLLWLLWTATIADAGKLATPSNHADWRWHSIETDHFRVHFPRSRTEPDLGAEAAAQRIAGEADGIWLRMGDVIGWYPTETLQVVVVDDSDDLRAWAWPLRGVVVISVSQGTELGRARSRGDGLVDVFAHELGHLFLHKRMASHSEVASFGSEGTGHVEAGGLAAGVQIPLAPTVPQWWSEGGAEFLAAQSGHGWWSPAREAGLRAAVLEDRLLSWGELQVDVDKGDAGDGERAYQQGFAFLLWLEQEYGEGTIAALAVRSAERGRVEPTRVLREQTGERPAALYARHVDDLRAGAEAWLAQRTAAGVAEGQELWTWAPDWPPADLDDADLLAGLPRREREEQRERTGTWNLHPRWSADGRWLGEHRAGWVRVRRTEAALWPPLSGQKLDYTEASARRAELSGSEAWIPGRFGSSFSFVPGSDAVVLSGPVPLFGPEDSDERTQIYRVELAPREVRGPRDPAPRIDRMRRRAAAIQGTERGLDPAVSPDGSRLAFVRERAGRGQLLVCDLSDCEPTVWWELELGETVRGPSWSPAGDEVVVAAHRAQRNDLYRVSADGAVGLTADRHEQSDPWWAADGIYAVADVGGVHDVVRYDLDGAGTRVTRVTGMAATPSITSDGHLLYAQRTAHGWKSMVLRREAFLDHPLSVEPQVDIGPVARVEPSVHEVQSYRLARSFMPVAVAPELRLSADPSSVGALAGAWILLRDPAEQVELSARGLVGADALVDGALTLRFLPVDLVLWGGWEDDQRWTAGGLTSLQRSRVQLGGAGLAVRGTVFPDLLSWVVETQRAELAQRILTRQVLWQNQRASAGLVFGDSGYARTIAETGAVLAIAGSVGVNPPGQRTWRRGDLDASARGRLGSFRIDAGVSGGVVDGAFSVYDRLRAGADVPSALRPSVIEAARALPGFAPRSVAGSRLAIGTIGVGLPITHIRSRAGPIYLDDLGVRVGADLAGAWDRGDLDVPLLGDVVGEVRLAAVAGDQTWDSVVRVASGLGEPAPTGDATDAIVGQGPVRVLIGLGTGW